MADSYVEADTPWRDESVMRELAVEERLSGAQIADRLGCSNPTARRWLENHGITDKDRYPWKDAELMCSLHDEGVDRSEIAERLDCSEATIRRWMPKHLKQRGDAHACPDCDSVFESRRALNLHHGQVHDGRVAGYPIECAHCGAERRLPRCQVNDDSRNFCGNDCRLAWMQERGRVETECSMCSATLSRKKWRVDAHEHQFCPDGCFVEWQRLQTGEASPLYKERLEFECNWCSSPVKKRQSDEILENQYCNERCYGQWLSENRTGSDHPCWDGGEFPYGPGFNEAKKEAVRERDNRECQGCGMPEAEHIGRFGRKLSVHHIQKARQFDDPRKRNHMDNLVSLCEEEGGCHTLAEQMSPLYPFAD